RARTIVSIPLLDEAERNRILIEWNATGQTNGAETLVHELIEQQARTRPEADALVYLNESMSYGELNRRANQIARYLERKGVGPEDVVGVWTTRGMKMIAAILGILKSGAAYLPIDVGHPAQRALFMLEDSNSGLVIVGNETAGKTGGSIEELDLETRWSEIELQSEAEPEVMVNGENLAYVIYTSGSTGEPKGAMIPHRSPVKRVRF